MNLSFQNRIALYYLIATALIIGVVFGVVFGIVRSTVYRNLDKDLSIEAEKHLAEVEILGDSIRFVNKAEWEEREHREAQVNPVFIQIINLEGRLMDKSPNLKENQLTFVPDQQTRNYFNQWLSDRAIRQVQMPVIEAGQERGYILAAMSRESAEIVILDLGRVLLIGFPMILLGLFFVSRWLAGRSILPLRKITETTDKITRNNLNERIALPTRKDELYALASSTNELLDRIQKALDRERQFTSDASHELRTPLAALRGTLEVLIRKPREQAEYQTKIKSSLAEIDRINLTLEQLLVLARFEKKGEIGKTKRIPLSALLEEILLARKTEINEKELVVELEAYGHEGWKVPRYHAHLILDNLLQNALKYSYPGGRISIAVTGTEPSPVVIFTDEGIGIRAEDLEAVFNPFFRSAPLEHKHIPGNGLGLSIAQKAAEAIGAKLELKSNPESHQKATGTTATVIF